MNTHVSNAELTLSAEDQLSQVANLTAALQSVVWQFAQHHTQDSELNQIRNALTGICNALEIATSGACGSAFSPDAPPRFVMEPTTKP